MWERQWSQLQLQFLPPPQQRHPPTPPPKTVVETGNILARAATYIAVWAAHDANLSLCNKEITTPSTMGAVLQCITNHFTVIKPRNHLQRHLTRKNETLIFGCGKFSRGWLLFAAFFIQLCLGSKYAWSVYNASIAFQIGADVMSVSRTLSIAILFVGFTNFVAGPVITRNGPRRPCLLGITLFMLGHLGAALACQIKSLALVYISYGVVGGAGVGITFLCPVFTLQRYFPDSRGFAAGFAVGGYGAGIAIGSLSQSALLGYTSIKTTFVIMGLLYAAVQFPCALMLRFPSDKIPFRPAEKIASPPHGQTQQSQHQKPPKPIDKHHYIGEEHKQFTTLRSVLTHPFFVVTYLLVIAHQLGGLLFFSRAADILRNDFGLSSETTSNAVAALGIFNAGGRIVMGLLCDRVAPSSVFLTTISAQLVVAIGMWFSLMASSLIGFCVAGCALIFLYGALFGMLAVLLVELYGARWLDRTFGIMLTGFGLDGLLSGLIAKPLLDAGKKVYPQASSLSIFGKNRKLNYNFMYYALLPIICTGIICASSIVIYVTTRKRRLTQKLKNNNA